MKKQPRYSKEMMYSLVAKWRGSGLSQNKFCIDENISKSTFGYWVTKFRKEKGLTRSSLKNPKTFIPIELPRTMSSPIAEVDQIEIVYPNGIRLSCPVNIDSVQLKSLINI